MSDLPKGWTDSRLGDLGNYVNGRAFKPTEWKDSGLPIIRIQNLNDSKIRFNYSDKEHEEKYRVKNGDLLIAWSASLGTFIWERGDAWLNQHIFRAEPREQIVTKEFLHFAVKEAIAELYLKAHGSGMVHVTKPVFESHEIPLPPLNEQKRIVEKLEKLLGRVEAAQERLDKIPAILKRFRQSVLAAACSGRLTVDWRENKEINSETDLPVGWEKSTFGELMCETPQNGLYKPQSSYGQGTPIVRIDNFYSGVIEDWQNLKRLTLTKAEINTYRLENNEILVNRVNSMKYLGKSALVKDLSEPCVFESNMMRIKLDKAKLIPKYAILFLNSLIGLEELRKNAKHAVNQSSINQQDVSATIVSLPPLEEQKEIVRRVEDLFKFVNQIEERYKKARSYTDKLTQSILAKAFRGELVPQDPNDEPASVLLERIKNTASVEKAKGKSKKAKKTWFKN